MDIPRLDAPPPDARSIHLPLVRLPARASWNVAITCWEPLQIHTHFLGRRTLPHVATNCPGCKAKKPKRYEAYISGLRGYDQRHVIVALTAGALTDIMRGVKLLTQLRGHIVTIERQGTRPNGILTAKVRDEMCNTDKWSAAPDLLQHMLAIWRLDQNHVGSDNPGYEDALKKDLTDDDADNGP